MHINLTYLKSLLYNFLKEYDEKRDRKNEIDLKKSLYKGVIDILNSSIEEQMDNISALDLLLDGIYGTDVSINRIFKILSQLMKYKGKSSDLYLEVEQQLNAIKEKITSEYQALLVEEEQVNKYLELNKDRKKYFAAIIYRLKNSQFISETEFQELSNFFDDIHLETTTQIKLFEPIKIHNMDCKKRFSKNGADEKYGLLNMLNFGFEQIDDSEIEYDSRTPKEVELQYQLMEYYDISDFIKQLYLYYSDRNLLQAVVLGLITKIQLELSEQIFLIKDKDFYVDKELRESIYKEFNEKLNAYIHLRELFDTFEVEPTEETVNNNILVYALKPSGKPYILDDIQTVPDEYLTTVSRLLNNLKDGSVSKTQLCGFGDKYKPFKKLKYDQIRIVLKLVAKSTYCVLGVAVKKETKGNSIYDKLCSRVPVTNLDAALEQRFEIEEQLETYIKENATKGNR